MLLRMNAENKPVGNVTAAENFSVNAGSFLQWRLILLVLCAVGAALLVAVLALQVTEYRFYKAAPNVWPQPNAGNTFGAPVAATP